MKTEETMVERGSRNVFADLGFPDSDTHLLIAIAVKTNFRGSPREVNLVKDASQSIQFATVEIVLPK